MERGSLALVTLALLASGCGGGAADADRPPEAPSSASPTPSESATSPPAEESEAPAVEPARGPVVDVEGHRVRAPQGWQVAFDTPISAIAGKGNDSLALTVIPNEQVSLDRAQRLTYATDGGKRPPGLKEMDATLGGLSAFAYTAPVGQFSRAYVVGRWDAGSIVKITLELDRDMPAAKAQEMVDSVVATYESP